MEFEGMNERIYRFTGTSINQKGGSPKDTALCCMPPSGRSGRFPALPYPPEWQKDHTRMRCWRKALRANDLKGQRERRANGA
jgi:hypothetical protein